MRNKDFRWLIVFLGFFLFSAGWEELGYLLSQAPGQIALLFHRTPIEKVLKKKELDPQTRAKLELVLEIKRYAEEEVGLVHNKSYTIYRPLKRKVLSWNLTACPKLSLEPLSWKFPLVGKVPYLGFFKKEDALKKKAELEAKGYEVYIRPVSAYSMLGIVADPVYSTMLKYQDYDLANLIIHELTHATIWAKGYPEFNENLALFVGNQGALNFCREKFNPDSEQVKYGIYSNYDDMVFQEYLRQLAKKLEELYSRKDLSEKEKLEKKQKILAQTKKDFEKNWLPKMKTGIYQGWLKKDLNNAVIASYRVYYHDLSLYQEVYEKLGEDLKRMVEFIKQVAEEESGNPEAYLRQWLKTQTSSN